MDYKEYFKIVEKLPPKTERVPDSCSSQFWENLYLAFKYRFIEEQNAELKAMMDKEYEQRVMD